ncbi:DNA-3-methyladenine glycosylase I [Rhodococcus hoagii]|nr:DNA-3-methyladenine glycosylase I [Prescottella equi]
MTLDERSRCPWAVDSAGSRLYTDYHDLEWGQPLHGRDELFEPVPGGVPAGLSWITILRKREAFRKAFDGFDPERVAVYREADVERLLGDAGSSATARRSRPSSGTRARRPRPVRHGPRHAAVVVRTAAARQAPGPSRDVPAVTPESTAMAKELKRRGFRFVGPTTAYALMQATGMWTITSRRAGSNRAREGAGFEGFCASATRQPTR